MQKQKNINLKIGMPPGSLDYIGESEQLDTTIEVRSYNRDNFIENTITNPSAIKQHFKDEYVNWIEVTGLRNLESIAEIGNQFNIHPMLLEDVLNTDHLPKYEEEENYNAIILKAYSQDENGIFKRNHICLVLTDNCIIQMQDYENEILRNKIERIRQSKGRAREKKADYLFYILLDAFVDTYYLFFSDINEQISNLEEKLLSNKSGNLMEQIHNIKFELNNLRKNLFPLRESITELISNEPNYISKENLVYFNDLRDHLNQLVEFYLLYNENIKSLIDLNNSNQNNNMNAIMKTLTIIATIFIPLTFIAGIYGMNFEYMPELDWEWAYFMILGVMFTVTLGMVMYFKRKKWF